MNSRLRTLTRRNLILMGAVVVLGLILALRPDTVTSIDKDDLPAVFPGFASEDVRRIEVSRMRPTGAESVRLELAAGGNAWHLASHFEYPTQAGAARLLDAVAAARSRGDVTRRKETFDKYAGDGGWIDVRLTDVQGRDTVVFSIGRYSYPETFLKIGSGAEARVVKAINISPGVARTEVRSWIETRLWPELSSTNAVRIDVEQTADERTITLVKRGEREADVGMAVPAKPEGGSTWWMASPTPAEGQDMATEDLLRQFTGILVEDIVAGDAAAADATHGFDKPELVATLHHKVDDKVTRYTLVVGSKVPGQEQWYVQRRGARWVFTVGASSLSRMRQMPDEYQAPAPKVVIKKADAPKKDVVLKDKPKADEPKADEPKAGDGK